MRTIAILAIVLLCVVPCMAGECIDYNAIWERFCPINIKGSNKDNGDWFYPAPFYCIWNKTCGQLHGKVGPFLEGRRFSFSKHGCYSDWLSAESADEVLIDRLVFGWQ